MLFETKLLEIYRVSGFRGNSWWFTKAFLNETVHNLRVIKHVKAMRLWQCTFQTPAVPVPVNYPNFRNKQSLKYRNNKEKKSDVYPGDRDGFMITRRPGKRPRILGTHSNIWTPCTTRHNTWNLLQTIPGELSHVSLSTWLRRNANAN